MQRVIPGGNSLGPYGSCFEKRFTQLASFSTSTFVVAEGVLYGRILAIAGIRLPLSHQGRHQTYCEAAECCR